LERDKFGSELNIRQVTLVLTETWHWY